ncbi:MAG: taurine ABC transporter substrate-binding protein [Rhizobiaceae bacterium]
MPANDLTIAIDLYDRHLPLFDGRIRPKTDRGVEFLEVGMVPPRRHGVDRHKRMLVDREFDAAEVSLASYLVARDQGMDDLVALPIFPRRLFSQNHIFVSDAANISSPQDLVGKRVVIWAFQVTMSVLAKGDLKREYGVDWRDIRWQCQHPEEIDTDYGGEVTLDPVPPGTDLVEALRNGTYDAYINPHPPEAIMTPDQGISRLFANWQETNGSYFRKRGYFPIMHVLAVKRALLEDNPELAVALFDAFNDAKAMARDAYVDPNYSMLMHSRNLLESEMVGFAPDVWKNGYDANRQNLVDFAEYCMDQKLIDLSFDIDGAFFPLVREDNRIAV